MKCEKTIAKFADYLAGELDSTERRELDEHLAECPTCGAELRSLSETWTRLGVLPEERPSPDLRRRFYKMLEVSKGEIAKDKRAEKRALRSEGGWFRRPAFQLGAAAALLAVGILAGLGLGRFGRGGEASLAAVHQEMQDMRQTLAVSLMKQDSPFARLEGVGLSRELTAPKPDFVETLFQTLDNDPNVNVRLAVVDALYLYSNRPGVSDRVLQSLDTQQSPLVQAALIDLLVGLRERRAVESLRLLLEEKNLNPQVKQRAESGLRQLTS
jgi:hypothetical protein